MLKHLKLETRTCFTAMATPSDQPADEQDAHSGARQPAAASSSSSYEMIASDAGASTSVGSSLAREFETWERLTISSSVPPSDSGYAPSGYEWVQPWRGTTRRDHSVPPLGADVDQTAGASGPGEEAPVVPSSSATAGGSASRLVPLPSAAAQAADEPDGVPDMPQRPAAHSGALQPAAASSSSRYEVIASGGASETQEEQQQPAQPAATADEGPLQWTIAPISSAPVGGSAGQPAPQPQLAIKRDVLEPLLEACTWDDALGWMTPATGPDDRLFGMNWRNMLNLPAGREPTSFVPTFFPAEPDPNQRDKPRLDIVVSFDNGDSVRYHPRAEPIWSTSPQPTDAMQKRYNRARKLARARRES